MTESLAQPHLLMAVTQNWECGGAYPAMVRWEQGVVIVDKIKTDRLID